MNIMKIWNNLKYIPGRAQVFAAFIRKSVPYTGTVRPQIRELKPGYALIQMGDRRLVRNHLGSIHAAALMNFAEAASGLAFNSGLPENARAILVSFEIRYLKKARGTLTAECSAPILSPSAISKSEHILESIVRNEKNEIVAQAKATWLVSPAKDPNP